MWALVAVESARGGVGGAAAADADIVGNDKAGAAVGIAATGGFVTGAAMSALTSIFD
jgi:hypothetical protein